MTQALATPDDVRSFAGLAAGQDEVLLTSLIAAASAFVLAYIERPLGFVITQHTWHASGNGGATLVPKNRPITEVASLHIDGIAIPLAEVHSDLGYLFNETALYLRGYRFSCGVMNVDVVYSAGYAAIPDDVKQTVIEMVATKYQRRTRMGIASKTIGQETISYSASDMSNENLRALNAYKIRFL